MTFTIRDLVPADIDAVVEFSLRAWAPIFTSFEHVLGTEIYLRIYPDWASRQMEAVAASCRDENNKVWVAEVDGQPRGYAAVVFQDEGRTGEIDMLAVDPDFQGQGIGRALTDYAVERIREAGGTLAVVATGGDPGHAPARRTYEKAGFTGLPLVRYYRAL